MENKYKEKTHTTLIDRLEQSQRVAIINPTKYLGNFLISGGLIQNFCEHCKNLNISLLIVLDSRFKALSVNLFPNAELLFFERSKINSIKALNNIILTAFSIIKFRADIAFNLEEDSLTSHLTKLSSAKYKVGCSQNRHHIGYDEVLNINFNERENGKEHRWHSYHEVFSKFGMIKNKVSYISLNKKYSSINIEKNKSSIIAIHPCATKNYKVWGSTNFINLAISLEKKGFQIVFIGKGDSDRATINNILNFLSVLNLKIQPINLSNRLSLVDLQSLFSIVTAVVGNDSGPSHLSSALEIPTCVVFGPTDENIWRPLGKYSKVITGRDKCESNCKRSNCNNNYRCLESITPSQIEKELLILINKKNHSMSN